MSFNDDDDGSVVVVLWSCRILESVGSVVVVVGCVGGVGVVVL